MKTQITLKIAENELTLLKNAVKARIFALEQGLDPFGCESICPDLISYYSELLDKLKSYENSAY